MSQDHHKTLAELAITDLECAADEYRSRAASAATVADRDSHSRVADGFERIVERRRQACRAAQSGGMSFVRASQ